MITNKALIKVLKKLSFFKSKADPELLYVEYDNIHTQKEFAPLESEKFKAFLHYQFLDDLDVEDALISSGVLNNAVHSIMHIVNYRKSFTYADIYSRNSGNLNIGLEYDLLNDSQQSVKIDRNGWTVSSPKQRKFVSYDTSLPQVDPVPTEASVLDLLQPYINITGDDYVLFVSWLIQAFSKGSHHALLIYAERGSGKTTFSRVIKKIVDPGTFDVTTIPKGEDSLRVLLRNNYLVPFDNVSIISDGVSDLFCGAVTGTSIVTRSLYTNNSQNVAKLHNVLVINGIGVVPPKKDLEERTLIMHLQKLTDEELNLDFDLWENFDIQLPEILGAIFNTLSKAMSLISTIDKSQKKRMADSFIEMLAIAKALGVPEDEFRRIYQQNKDHLEQICLAAHSAQPVAPYIEPPIVVAVKEFMANVSGRKYSASAQDVFTAVHSAYSGDKALLPASASHFSKRLDKEFSNLLKAGFRVNIDDTGAKGTQIEIIKKK